MWKRITLIAMLPAGIYLGYIFYLTWALGFTISKFCGGKETGRPGRVKSISFSLRNHELHLHHWFICLLAGAISLISGFFLLGTGFFYGFLSGAVFQGIYCYSDWHHIIKKKEIPENLD